MVGQAAQAPRKLLKIVVLNGGITRHWGYYVERDARNISKCIKNRTIETRYGIARIKHKHTPPGHSWLGYFCLLAGNCCFCRFVSLHKFSFAIISWQIEDKMTWSENISRTVGVARVSKATVSDCYCHCGPHSLAPPLPPLVGRFGRCKGNCENAIPQRSHWRWNEEMKI